MPPSPSPIPFSLQDSHTEPTEQTLLLSGEQVVLDGPANDRHPSDPTKPLPKLQIALLCFARMMEAIAFLHIFPYIAQMVQQNGHLAASDVGFYSGLIESLFSITQMFVLIAWGRLSDRIGRKPILIYSLVGIALGSMLFGVATTIWQMILFRWTAGIFSGSGLMIRTMVTENSTPATQARAFSWFAFGGNMGVFLGPIIGGALADPVTQYPHIFKDLQFFENYPYALPGFVTGAIGLTGAIIIAVFLDETLVKCGAPEDELVQQVPDPATVTLWELIQSPGVSFVLFIYSHIMFLTFAYTAVEPVALYTPVDIGGLGFSSTLIAVFLATQGVSQALWLLVAFPWLQHRVGTKGVIKACGVAYPFFFAGFILLNIQLRDSSHGAVTWFWIIGAIIALAGPGISMCFTGAQLALNDVAPSPSVLGTLNAIALTASSGIRSIAPSIATITYAAGVRNQILHGYLAWILLIAFAAVLAVGARWLPEKKETEHTNESNDEL